MRRGRRFLAYGVGALATAAAGRWVARRDLRRIDPEASELLGSLRGTPRTLRGPRASRLYAEWFPPAGARAGTLVFTHGWCLTEAVWHYQKRELAGDRFGVVTWDLPGHGHSPGVAPGALTLEFCADALARIVDQHADGGTVLVGHSLGGVISLAYLHRHPETARRLIRGVVLGSTPIMHVARSVAGNWPGARLESRAISTVIQKVVESELAERVLGRDMGRRDLSLSYRMVRWGFGRRPSQSQVLFVRDAIASVRPDVRAETHRLMTTCNLAPLLPQITVPALVLIGGRDRMVNPEESRQLAERLPKGRGVVFPDAGHAAFLEDHGRFNAEVRRFALRRLDPPRARSAGARSAGIQSA